MTWQQRLPSLEINKKLLPLKGLMFFFYAGQATLIPFLTIYMKSIGISAAQGAYIFGTLPLVNFMGPPLVGALADKIGKHRLVVLVFTLLAGACFNVILLIPPASWVPDKEFLRDNFVLKCYPEESVVVERRTHFSGTCAKCRDLPPHSNYVLEECFMVCEQKQSNWLMCFNETHGRAASGLLPEGGCIEYKDSKNGILPLEDVSLNHIPGDDGLHYGDPATCHAFLFRDFDYGFNYTSLKCRGIPDAEDWDPGCHVQCHIIPDFNNTTPLECREIYRTGNIDVTFGSYYLMRIVAGMCNDVVVSLIDVIILKNLETSGGDYGSQRVWCALGMCTFSLASGGIRDWYTEYKGLDQPNFSLAFYMIAFFMAVTALILATLKMPDDMRASNMFQNMGVVLKDFEIVAFLVAVLVLGMSLGFIEAYLFWFLEDLKAPQLLLGLTVTVGTTASLPFLAYAGRIIKTFGHMNIMIAAFVCYAIRFVGYSFVTNPWWAMPLEAMEAITMNLMWVTAVSYGHIIAPKGMLGTVQGLMGGTHYGIGKGLGSLLGGLLYDAYGANTAFQYWGIGALTFGIIYFLVHYLVIRPRSRARNYDDKMVQDDGTIDFRRTSIQNDLDEAGGLPRVEDADRLEKKRIPPPSEVVSQQPSGRVEVSLPSVEGAAKKHALVNRRVSGAMLIDGESEDDESAPGETLPDQSRDTGQDNMTFTLEEEEMKEATTKAAADAGQQDTANEDDQSTSQL